MGPSHHLSSHPVNDEEMSSLRDPYWVSVLGPSFKERLEVIYGRQWLADTVVEALGCAY
jgi:hypothetical protein